MFLLLSTIIVSLLQQPVKRQSFPQPKEVVRSFLADVRSGKYPERAVKYMADTVLAHQINSENPVTV